MTWELNVDEGMLEGGREGDRGEQGSGGGGGAKTEIRKRGYICIKKSREVLTGVERS